jgi:hypothetical protein
MMPELFCGLMQSKPAYHIEHYGHSFEADLRQIVLNNGTKFRENYTLSKYFYRKLVSCRLLMS